MASAHARATSAPSRRRAVVLGASVAGLTAARVLSEHYDDVIVVERDPVRRAEAGHRSGLPQGHHQHVLLQRGRDELERLFPGFDADLAAAGAPLADYGADFVLFSPAGRVPEFHSGIELRVCRRMHIDHALVRRVQEIPNVRIDEGVAVRGLVADANATAVTGVSLRDGRELSADLVVDASGRRSRAPEWLEALGYDAPEEEVVDANTGYASRLYEPPAELRGRFRAVELTARPPEAPRAAGLWEIEGGKWLLSLIGTAGVLPPTDDAGFLEFARQLPDPIVYDAIRDARPLGPIKGHQGVPNRWRHFERLRRLPEGLLVLGDAYCSLNPLYGQGMTLAVLDAVHLGRVLSRTRSGDGRARSGLARRFHRGLRRHRQPAWLLATCDDYRWPSTRGAGPDLVSRLSIAWFEQLIPLSTSSADVARAFVAVLNMVRSPAVLFHPRILAQLALHHVRRWRGGEPAARGTAAVRRA